MRLNRLFIGKFEPIRRPTNAVNEALLGRMQQAKQALRARGKDVVSVRDVSTETTGPASHAALVRPFDRPSALIRNHCGGRQAAY